MSAQPDATKVKDGGISKCIAGQNIVTAGIPFIRTFGQPKNTASGTGKDNGCSGSGCIGVNEPAGGPIKAGIPFNKIFG